MKRIVLMLTLLAILGEPSVCEAQRRSRWYVSGRGYWNPYGWGAYSATPIEGAQRGLAEVIRARGEAYQASTRGMINYEEARSRYIDNKLKWTKTYWERKRLGEAERKKDYDKKRARRDLYLASKKLGAPPRLSPNQLDPSTGKIYWPAALQVDVYADQRRKLEELFVLRAHTSSTSQLGRKIYTIARQMQTKLKSNIRNMFANDYIAARKFLDSLAYEGRLTPL